MTNLIPTKTGEELRTNARRGRKLKMENLLKLRNLLDEYRTEKVKINMEQFYDEASEWMDSQPSTVRDDMGVIREYEEAKLTLWIEAGLSFNHIATANWAVLQKGCFTDEPEKLLDDAAFMGDETGKRMTVKKMLVHAFGEQRKINFSFLATFQRWVSKLIAEIPQSWDEKRRKEFYTHLDALKALAEKE